MLRLEWTGHTGRVNEDGCRHAPVQMKVVWIWNCAGRDSQPRTAGFDYVTALDKIEGEVRGRGAWLSLPFCIRALG